MKPRRSPLSKFSFPTMIVVAAMPLLHAATINPDTFGNITVPSGTNAADTIIASGGTNTAPVVNIQTGAILTGDAVLQNGARITAPGYTLNNSGTLGGAAAGITVAVAATNTTIVNNSSGIIQGGTDGIFFDGSGGLVTNFGTISGTTGAGINAFDSATIDNFTTISSNAIEGIVINDNGTITNFTSFDLSGAPISGGIIQGATNGILAGDGLSLVNEQLSVIRGLNGIGVDAGDNAEIFNDFGAEITGSFGGVSVGANGYVENAGTLRGNGGDGVTLGANGEVFNTGLIEGTTGIVANNGSLVTNSGTIRSTAIGGNAFSGGDGDDSLFLNAGSLVAGNVLGGAGTNSITFNGGLTSPVSTANTISGSVSNFTTITKNGAGVALIGAVSDVGNGLTVSAETIAITSGGLYFNADITGLGGNKAVINAGGAAVGGTGLWNANLNITAGGISAGAIPINLDANPENAVGAVAITGDVVHSAGSFIRLDIVSGAPIIDGINSDIIEQIGAGNTYNVTGANLRISTTDGDKVITDGTYTLVDSDEAIIGANAIGTIGIQFNANTGATGPFFPTESGVNATNTVLTNYFLTTGLTDGGTNLVATVQHDYAGLPGLSGNESSLGGALDASVGSGNVLIQQFIAALDFSNLGAVQSTLASLNPATFISFSSGIVNSNYRLHRALQDHLATVRTGSDSVRVPMGGQVDSKGGMVATPPAAVSSSGKGTVWGSFSYDWQDYEGRESNSDFDGETGAVTAGFDYRVAPALVLGIVLDGSKSDFDGDGVGSEIESLRAIVYGTWGRSTGLYSDFLVGYGDHDIDLDRRAGGILSGSTSSSTDAESLQALWTIGYALGDSRVKHGPFAGLEYQTLDVDGYDQGGILPISVDGYDDDSLRALLGYRVDTNLGRFNPYASVTYAHEFEDDGVRTSASLDGVSFRVRGAERGSAVLLTAGTGISVTEALRLDVGYRGEISVDDEGIDSHGANLGLKYSF